ncbi:MAG TPA: cytochrome d ubiquinol oxidase subunit II, partial [Candidatus Baltobacteraceae bacterium]|nr:cytochrome d ubiquinol oxidase subunit II [Candidatus Baltobacteraceae bacterium]
EVWLIAAGATLFALFPRAYASSFSGFYLPFIVLLWLLMFRGMSLELRHHFPSRIWREFWDAAFAIASALLILVFGVALGNVLRGFPLDPTGYFRGTFAYLLNPYALLVGAFALAVLGMHGAAFAAMRIDGALGERALTLSSRLWWFVAALFVAVTVATFGVHGAPSVPAVAVFGALSVAALAAVFVALRKTLPVYAFAASSAFIVALMASAAAALYPFLLPAVAGSPGGITIFDAAPSPAALSTALTVTILGGSAVIIYTAAVWRRMAGKVRVE